VPEGPAQQHAFRRPSAEALVLSGVAKKIDNLVDLGLDLIDPATSSKVTRTLSGATRLSFPQLP